MILSGYYARLTSPAPDRPIPLHLPVSEITAVTESVIARNPNELARQDTRQTFATLILRGIRATLVPGVRLNPRALTAVRMIAQFSGRKYRLCPDISPAPAPRRQAHSVGANTFKASGEAEVTSTYLYASESVYGWVTADVKNYQKYHASCGPSSPQDRTPAMITNTAIRTPGATPVTSVTTISPEPPQLGR
jgi:hypothetical protein